MPGTVLSPVSMLAYLVLIAMSGSMSQTSFIGSIRQTWKASLKSHLESPCNIVLHVRFF